MSIDERIGNESKMPKRLISRVIETLSGLIRRNIEKRTTIGGEMRF
jgi:hypothetical protein